MQTIKLHEATKQFKISNKLAMFFLEKKNIPVKSHSSVISMEQLELLREFARNKDKSEIFAEFNRIEKEKKKRARQAKAAKKEEAVQESPAEPTAPPTPPAPATIPPATPKQEHPPRPKGRVERERRAPESMSPKPVVKVIRHDQKVEPKRKPEAATPPQTEKPKPQRQEPRAGAPRRPEDKKAAPAAPQGAHAANKPKHERHERQERPGGERPHKDKKQHPKSDSRREPRKQDKGRPAHIPAAQVIEKKTSEPVTKPRIMPGVPIPVTPGGGKAGQQFNRPKGGPQGKFAYHKGKQAYRNRQAPTPKVKAKPRVYDLPDLIQISDYISTRELAEKMNLKLKDIEERMGALNKDYATNQILDVSEIKDICGEFGVEVDIISYEDFVHYQHIEDNNAQLDSRAPVVTVMGHVDHGKTTLLDTLRNTRVAAREAGGITQKIGAYKLTYNGSDIIFLDTPGHEAFTNIRARGAKITDIVVLVVAANDGVKPQTIEAINHAQAADVPIIVAINKIDLPGADPNRVKQELTKYNILVEDWGGDVVAVEISAKNNENLDSLLEMLTLVSEMTEAKAYKAIPARGTIIESRLDPKLGPLGTVLIQHGTVKCGDVFICGDSVGKVKSLFDDQNEVLKEAEVPLPVELMGFENVPEAGERFQVIEDMEKARKVIDMRKVRDKEAKKEEVGQSKKLSLQNLFDQLGENKVKEFPIIIKSDNYSSGEVLENILLKLSQEKLKINIIHQNIGNITESDVLLASTSNSIIIGFNVKAPQKIIQLAKREQVEIKLYNVIYHLSEDIEKAIKGELEPEYIETRIGGVEVLQTFKISKVGIIAGCLVKEGKVTNKSKIKVIRKNDLVFEGAIETLRRIKNEVSEVNAGTECGIRVKNFNAIEVGDFLEVYETRIKE